MWKIYVVLRKICSLIESDKTIIFYNKSTCFFFSFLGSGNSNFLLSARVPQVHAVEWQRVRLHPVHGHHVEQQQLLSHAQRAAEHGGACAVDYALLLLQYTWQVTHSLYFKEI